MNTKNLYEKDDYDIYSIYYLDKECTQPYTGHVEEYWNGRLSWEEDVVNGFGEGLRKEYDDIYGMLESVKEVRHNKINGLGLAIDYCFYDEIGKLTEEFYLSEPFYILGIDTSRIKEKIPAMREKYNLKKLNEEILKFGKPMEYGMPIYPKQHLYDKKDV